LFSNTNAAAMAAMAAAPDCRMRPSTTTLALAAAATAATGRPIQDSVLGLSEIAWAGEFTHSSEGPLRGGCAASDSKADQAHCLGPSFYLGTPSVVRSPLTGHLLASADLFDHGPSAACWPYFFVAHRDKTWPKWKRNATLFRSVDNGTSWQRRGWVTEHYWSSLFAHAGAVYYFGVSNDSNGAVKLSRSIDDGRTWRQSVLRGGERYTTGATAVTFAQGRVWRAFEGGPKRASMMFSADAGADLLDPSAWQRTAPLEFNLSWIPSCASLASQARTATALPLSTFAFDLCMCVRVRVVVCDRALAVFCCSIRPGGEAGAAMGGGQRGGRARRADVQSTEDGERLEQGQTHR
jgi:hypothetical protein